MILYIYHTHNCFECYWRTSKQTFHHNNPFWTWHVLHNYYYLYKCVFNRKFPFFSQCFEIYCLFQSPNRILLLRFLKNMHCAISGVGGTDLERGYGDVRPWRPPFTPFLPLTRVPFRAKELVHKTPFWENLEILASPASIFAQILALKPPNLKIFSSQSPKFGNFQFTSPSFQRQISVCKPHTSEIRAAHPYLKKVECPPPGAIFVRW